jgi:hypothetical protein
MSGELVREVWLTCPSCGYRWRAIVLPATSPLPPAEFAIGGCNVCPFPGKMRVAVKETPREQSIRQRTSNEGK